MRDRTTGIDIVESSLIESRCKKTNLLVTLLALWIFPAFATKPNETLINPDQSIQVVTETGMTQITPWLKGTIRIVADTTSVWPIAFLTVVEDHSNK
jgi:hypothetical protein